MSEKDNVYLFIDEGGDSSFYAYRKKLLVGSSGFQPMLNLGMVTMTDRQKIKQAIVQFISDLKADPLYNSIHTLSKPEWYLHACNDHPEIRAKFFEFLRNLDGFKSYIVIGRKRLSTFQNKHNSNEKEFYFDLVYHLLKDRLKDESVVYHIFLSSRQKSTQEFLESAIAKAIERDNKKRTTPLKISYKFDIVRSQDTYELSIIDYLLWGLHRYIIKDESRFYDALLHKYNLIIDLYDIDRYKSGSKNNYYHKDNIFDKSKASEFKSDGYV